ncbi:hypothetical protein BV22DRAFT_1025464 [Leucogyrophana mollusca]|uniref:Uncharacterized protein n=1 Tax=Leucogyrophana mollusca TaxID=85980 RepID=A0ACB8AYM8_9AGAM|nr:hypothetical protein BV22DRAFT_1025464 [Leucogyrophana mollusca]
MLANPDLQLGASMNRWIIGILMFHFELVHVPGVNHGPDGLLRRPPQLGDEEEPYDNDTFDEWVDQAYGFLNLVNPDPVVYVATAQETKLVLANEVVAAGAVPKEFADASYSDVPRSVKAGLEDERLGRVREWLATAKQPAMLSDEEFTVFTRFAAHFFLAGEQLY